nr:transposase [Streptomyces sp. CB00271]
MGRIEPLLPQVDGRGRPWRDHRQVVNGVLWRLRTGAPWRDLPERYGPWQTVYERFARGEADGTWASCWSTSRAVTMRRAGWSGPSPSTPRSTGPLAGVPGTRSVSGRVDHQGPSRRRRPGAAAVDCAHTRKRQRRHSVRRCPRWGTHSSGRHGPPAHGSVRSQPGSTSSRTATARESSWPP